MFDNHSIMLSGIACKEKLVESIQVTCELKTH